MAAPGKSTIGAIQWGQMRAGTTGEQIALVLPAYFQANHVPFLEGILTSRLDEIFGDDGLSLVLEPGHLRQTKTGQRHEPGRIIIYGLREPWPDPAEFRHALDDAFREAAEVEAEQMRRANSLVRHLRAGLRPDR